MMLCNRIELVLALFAILMAMLAVPATAQRTPDYYTESQIHKSRPYPTREYDLGPIGVTGIEARIYPGVLVTVEQTQPNTPAYGKFNKGDVIVGVNGVVLKGKNPLVILGEALTKAEASDGVLTFEVKPGKEGQVKKVTVKIPVMGAYSKTFPLQCDKSRRIIKRAAEYYSRPDRLKSKTFLDGLACLFLLSTGNDAYLPRVTLVQNNPEFPIGYKRS